MARLNEPPIAPAPSVDTLDAVKRRYLRQNRELAKTNSQQSMRIRTLENDASRLLAENLSLREQVLQLQSALEAQSYRPSFEVIESMKNQLETKLQELGGLVAEFGQLKKKDEARPRCKSQTAATRRSPDERQWRSGLGLQEVENAMLPTITEDKYYPRQTMNAEELQDILAARDSQSPDIGPPPISRFDDQEPIAFNPSGSPGERPAQLVEDQAPALPATLETRRKRRESGPRLDVCRVPMFESPPDDAEKPSAAAVRVGSKRKFSVQEDEEKARPPTESFRFSRRNAPPQPEDPKSTESSRPSSPDRPALSNKPVNTDPILSPKKQRSSSAGKLEKKPLPKTSRNRLTITRDVHPELPAMELPPPMPVAEITLDELPPKTPAVALVFSPPTTESSAPRAESKDTPPPGDLSNAAGMTARPSRRARPQVSYKEPPLNTKMRRPGKELVDAVNPDHSSRASLDSQSLPTSVSKGSMSQERDGSTWKPVGTRTSAGRMTDEAAEAGSPLRQKLDRKEGQDVKTEESNGNPSVSNAIPATISETNTTKRRVTAALPKIAHKSDSECIAVASTEHIKKEDDMAVFEFNESSPAHEAKSTIASNHSRSRIEVAKAARNARRHSSVPVSASNDDLGMGSSVKMERTDGPQPSVHRRTGSGAARSSGTSNLARSVANARISARDRERKSTVVPANANTASGASRNENDDLTNAKAERAAHRRKSMII
ncbi:hypothetical protein DM02DRAFT_227961 [Periconia macrospinosa]|uniref:Shugoshin n=1 Tax=Periconia macrospinosa TaxID=97972 RepID=A0A2V1D734_9PLEO|nr:hypothetical protein DM02DRAFT_227961 [Periconia macrospinosa]